MSEFEPKPALPYEHPEVQKLLIKNTTAAIVGGLADRYKNILQLAVERSRRSQQSTKNNLSFMIDAIDRGKGAEAMFAAHRAVKVFEGVEEEHIYLSKVNRRGKIISGSLLEVGSVNHQTGEILVVEQGFTERDLDTVQIMYEMQAGLPWQPVYGRDSGLVHVSDF